MAANAKTGTLYLIGIQSRSKSLCAGTNTVPLRTEEVAHSRNGGTESSVLAIFDNAAQGGLVSDGPSPLDPCPRYLGNLAISLTFSPQAAFSL
jgi:hypothetical protein